MKAVVLEDKGKISLRDFDLDDQMTADDVRIKPVAVGICGSDVHYYKEGNIGNFIVKEPMILGHEASGVVTEVGANVKHLSVGDRVCMEPGIPNFKSTETLQGMYNLDPDVAFWATPPIHGCLRESVVHPGSLTFKLPDNVSFHEGALVEPVAIGMHSANKAEISSGDTALVMGAGTIGIVTALAAEASGCSKVFIADIKKEKLDFVKKHYSARVTAIDLKSQAIKDVLTASDVDLVDIVFEASGSPKAFEGIADYVKPGGTIVLIGMPSGPVPLDIVSLQAKELNIKTIFRYVNIYPRVINLISSGKLNVKPLVTSTYNFKDAVKAMEYAATLPNDEIKIMIDTDF
ncbi:NAD(P)-dependent alcohol dehydrogenase [Oceanispirochaeta crateris]|uniref:NAD(P)-dependent alcohol dehydrogenase n=1 Tax=Oceanispirochaeta crateris TaxID=2518645 RepID=A0A5C1QKQ2_9SPIO|nr:NAD(P)-dependent alcohol dehydrogenase [Oceanispirochaeta crateris]QEN08181.1 NAD(P)-dependent alcohol dehydrogenase [Oceanispirochaeta crateris]